MKRVTAWTGILLAMLGLGPEVVGAAPRGPLRGLFRREIREVLRRDLVRDRRLPVSRLERPLTVHRYTTLSQARRELREGLAPGTHTTAHARPGRPPSPETAQRRYGLPRKPEARETISLPEGTPVRRGKALGGRPGVGEIITARRVPPEAIRRVTPLLPRKP